MSQIQKKNRWKSFLVFFKYSKEKIGIFKFEFSSRAPHKSRPPPGSNLGKREREREREKGREGGEVQKWETSKGA